MTWQKSRKKNCKKKSRKHMIESRMTSQGNGCIMCEIHHGIGMWKKSQWEGIKGKEKTKTKRQWWRTYLDYATMLIPWMHLKQRQRHNNPNTTSQNAHQISNQVTNKWNGLPEAPTLAVFWKEIRYYPKGAWIEVQL